MSHLEVLFKRYPQLADIQSDIYEAVDMIRTCYKNGGKLLVAGNGGSAADADHIVGELMKGFLKRRPISQGLAEKLIQAEETMGGLLVCHLQQALPAINLTAQTALCTAYCNDADSQCVFAQLVMGYGRPRDIFFGISTSGNAQNVVLAALTAKACGLKTIAFTGAEGGRLGKMADVAVKAPGSASYEVQEYHLPIYHAICLQLEEEFFES